MRNFEEFTLRAVPASRKTPRVAIQSRGNISMNLAAFQQLGEPQAVILMFDKDSRAVGMRSVPIETKHAFPIRRQPNSKSFVIGAASFCNHYGIVFDGTTVFIPQFEDNILVFEVDKGTVLPVRKRGQKHSEDGTDGK